MNTVESEMLARNVRRLGHLDLPGAGQVTVRGSHAYVGHIPNAHHLGTSIIDIGDPRQPRVIATVTLDDPTVKTSLGDLGVDIIGGTPEEFAAYIRSEIPKWTAIIKASGAKLD